MCKKRFDFVDSFCAKIYLKQYNFNCTKKDIYNKSISNKIIAILIIFEIDNSTRKIDCNVFVQSIICDNKSTFINIFYCYFFYIFFRYLLISF